MILSFFTQKSTRSAKLSSVFAERFSGEGQADFAINKAHKESLKGRNNLCISCVFNGFKYTCNYCYFLLPVHQQLYSLMDIQSLVSSNQELGNRLYFSLQLRCSVVSAGALCLFGSPK